MIKTNGKAQACGIKALFAQDAAILIFGDGKIIWGDKEFPCLENGAMDAALCSLTGNLLVLGDNGKISKITAKGVVTILPTADFGFADKLISAPKRGIWGISSSRKVYVIKNTGETLFEITPPMSPTSIAFDDAGNNLSVGHGKGLTIYDLKTGEDPIDLKAQGGVLASSFSPDLCFLVAATGEPALIGWRLHDGVAFRMAGYPAKPNSMAWLETKKLLVTSGGPVGVIWPFIGNDGPMGQNADTFRTRMGIVSAVAAAQDFVVLGYNDGGIDLVNTKARDFHHIGGNAPDNQAQIDLRKADNRVNSIAITKNARAISWVSEDGAWGIVRV